MENLTPTKTLAENTPTQKVGAITWHWLIKHPVEFSRNKHPRRQTPQRAGGSQLVHCRPSGADDPSLARVSQAANGWLVGTTEVMLRKLRVKVLAPVGVAISRSLRPAPPPASAGPAGTPERYAARVVASNPSTMTQVTSRSVAVRFQFTHRPL